MSILDEVRAAFELIDPMPARIPAAARTAFDWRDPDAALAELIADSSRAGSRLRGAPRLLSFTGTGVGVHVEVTGDGAVREVAGRLTPASTARLHLRHRAGELTADVDPGGHFLVENVPSGLVSLLFRLPDESSVVTTWIRL